MDIKSVRKVGNDYVFTVERTVQEEYRFGSPVSYDAEDGERDPGISEEDYVKSCAETLRQRFGSDTSDETDLTHLAL